MKKLFFVLLAAGLFVACGTKTEKEVTVNQDSLNQVAEQAKADSIAQAEAAALEQARLDSIAQAELAANGTAVKTTDKGTKPATTTTQKENTTVQKTVEKAVDKTVNATQTEVKKEGTNVKKGGR